MGKTIYFVYFVVGFMASFIIYTIFATVSCSNEVFVGDRLTACEEKGGHYNLYYSSFEKNYVERCDVVEDEIEEF